jgi:putative spermidine/putrescine transport system substrate-binding protein
MDRRSFLKNSLKASAALTLYPAIALATTGCQSQGEKVLRLMALKGTVPMQLPKQFSQGGGGAVDFKQMRQLRDLFGALQQWKRQTTGEVKTPKGLLPWAVPLIGTPGEATVPDLVTIGDFWLTLAIRQELLQPIAVDRIPSWSALDPKLRALVTRNEKGDLAAVGQVWAMPYRINCTVLVYRKDIFADRKLPLPTDWDDLWRSDLKGRISLLDQPREVIGLTLKMLGQSYNTEDLAAVPDLKAKLAQLHHNAKFYSSTHYLQPLTLDQTWLAMASSTDALLMMRRNPKLAAVFPKSGTALSADLWVQPALAKKAERSEALVQAIAAWCEYGVSADRAVQISQLTGGMSPMLAQMSEESLPEALRRNGVLRPGEEPLKNSEYLLPMREQTVDQWRSVWEVMRND